MTCEYAGTTYAESGDEISSTYEGRHITLAESLLTHPVHADNLVNKGDPVNIGTDLVGVAFISAVLNTDLISIDTEGIWALTCSADDYSGPSAIAVGDRLYISGVISGVGIISKDVSGVPFGYALTALGAGEDGLVAVKVHAGTNAAQP